MSSDCLAKTVFKTGRKSRMTCSFLALKRAEQYETWCRRCRSSWGVHQSWRAPSRARQPCNEMIKMCCQSFLQEGGVNLIHGVSKGDRSIVRKELGIFLIVFNKHNHLRV